MGLSTEIKLKWTPKYWSSKDWTIQQSCKHHEGRCYAAKVGFKRFGHCPNHLLWRLPLIWEVKDGTNGTYYLGSSLYLVGNTPGAILNFVRASTNGSHNMWINTSNLARMLDNEFHHLLSALASRKYRKSNDH